uniref:Vasoactive intestinal peptide n=1 Tax=Salarias fasciatus TaxID=181472 RepID=A0A672FPD1_SALFA
MCKAMLQRTGPHLLLLIALCSVLYSRTLSLPYTSMRPTRHADGLFTSGYSKLLGQLSARRYLESLIGKRVSDELMEEPVKRHSDAIFTDNYSRFRKQMAVKKYLNSVLTGKRSLEDPGSSDPEESRDEPNTFQESYDDINVDHLLNNFQLVGRHTHTHTHTPPEILRCFIGVRLHVLPPHNKLESPPLNLRL